MKGMNDSRNYSGPVQKNRPVSFVEFEMVKDQQKRLGLERSPGGVSNFYSNPGACSRRLGFLTSAKALVTK